MADRVTVYFVVYETDDGNARFTDATTSKEKAESVLAELSTLACFVRGAVNAHEFSVAEIRDSGISMLP